MNKRISVQVDGLKIVGEIYYPQKLNESNPVLCLCHGIPARIPDPNDRGYPVLAERFADEGFITLIFNFRGAGLSEGNLDLLGWTRDLTGMITYMSRLDKADGSRIFLMGFST